MVNLVFAGDSIASAYEARIIAAGGTISFTHLAAVRAFIATGKLEGWWDKIIDCCPFLGSNLVAGLCKLKVAPGSPSSIGAHNGFTDANYSLTHGVTVTGNSGVPATDKWLTTGVIPEDQGMGANNFSYGAGIVFDPGITDNGFSGQSWLGSYDATDAPGAHPAFALPMSSFHAFGWNRSFNAAWSLGPDNLMTGAIDGIGTIDTFFAGGFDPSTRYDLDIGFFRGRKFGAETPTGKGNVAFWFAGNWLTAAEVRGITAAARQMHVSARQVIVGTHDVFIGDSITAGGSSWAERVMVQRALTYPHYQGTNVAQSGIAASGSDFPTRYTGTGAYPVTIYFMNMGTNDASLDQGTDGGLSATPSLLAQYKQALVDAATTLKALNTLTALVTIGWHSGVGTSTPTARNVSYVDAALEAAAETGTLGIDIMRPMAATGDPQQFYLVGGADVHPNVAGHEFICDLVMAALEDWYG